jgi:pyruvate,water dikinase
MDNALCWLGEPCCSEQLVVGGKVANLSRLTATFRVPPGFCLTTSAYEQALLHAHTPGEPVSELSPPFLHVAIGAAYDALGVRCGEQAPRVAVRSSAVDEDSATASFAGQHESYLNLVGVDEIVAAVIRCWASASGERALAYRHQQGLALDNFRIAVLVQQLVAADVAAVVFSAHPVTGKREHIIVNASWGLGESIVGGTTTPDVFVVDKTDLRIVGREIGAKERMTVTRPGGTHDVDTPRLLRAQACLDDARVVEAARLAVSLEQAMGWPVDVECGYRGDTLYLLQCRPITTL